MNVARRTEKVYEGVFEDAQPRDKNWVHMVKRFYRRDGSWAKHLYVLCAIVEYIIYIVLEWLYPREEVDVAPKWPSPSKFI